MVSVKFAAMIAAANSSFSKNTKLLLWMIAMFSLGSGAHWVLLNLYFKEQGLGEAFIGQVTGLIALGTMCTTIPVAWFCGRMPIKWLLITSIFVNVTGDLLMTASVHPDAIRLGAFISGAGVATWMTATAPFIMRNAGPGSRGAIFSYRHGIQMLSSGIASLIFAGAVDRLISWGNPVASSYQSTLISASILKLTASVIGLFIKAQPPSPEERRSWRDFAAARDWRNLLKLASPTLIIGAGAGLTMPFMNLYFHRRFQLAPGEIGTYFSICMAFMTIGTLVGPRLARNRGNIHTIVATQLLSLPFMILLALTVDIAFALTAFFARATLMNMGHPLYHHFSMEIVEFRDQAATNAFQSLAWSTGWFFSSWIGGIVIERHGFTPTILGTAGLYLIATIVQLKFFSTPRFRLIGRQTAS